MLGDASAMSRNLHVLLSSLKGQGNVDGSDSGDSVWAVPSGSRTHQ